MADLDLVEVDSLEALVIIDNELDPLSPPAPDTVQVSGLMGSLAMHSSHQIHDRGEATKELQMEDICCSAHGLSILVVRLDSPGSSAKTGDANYYQTATKGDVKHSVLFDAGPEGGIWERNVKRLQPDLSTVEVVQLSHWHRDHSGMYFPSSTTIHPQMFYKVPYSHHPGGLTRAIQMITEAKRAKGHFEQVSVDLHPDRPDYRGLAIGPNIISLQADPTFEELETAGGVIHKNNGMHTVLDNFFLISGEIPRQTAYENGVKGGMRFDKEEKDWFSDELISDERFLLCNLKGMTFSDRSLRPLASG
jgi:7,8-dihydropterin-6-yl-methyl-4-(beta-D-ribofuranosyl)aminobenzene 5'-phosphate synthase